MEFTTDNIIVFLSELFYYACGKFQAFFAWLYETTLGDLVGFISGDMAELPIIVCIIGGGLIGYIGYLLTKWVIDILP